MINLFVVVCYLHGRTPNYAGFEVLTAVVMKSSIFWDIMQCSSLKVNWRFGRTYRLHLQGRRRIQARNYREESIKWVFWVVTPCSIVSTKVSRNHAAVVFRVDPEDGGSVFLKNCGTHLQLTAVETWKLIVLFLFLCSFPCCRLSILRTWSRPHIPRNLLASVRYNPNFLLLFFTKCQHLH
jgi:hypothetical protein